MPHDMYTQADVDKIVRHHVVRMRQAEARRVRLRSAVIVLLCALPVVFAVGRGTGNRGLTIRQAEAAAVPVPSELPQAVGRFYDTAQGVTCWLARDAYGEPAGLSCLPDQWLAPAQIAAAGAATP